MEQDSERVSYHLCSVQVKDSFTHYHWQTMRLVQSEDTSRLNEQSLTDGIEEIMHTIFLRALIFWSSFRFIAKTSRKYRGLLYIPRLHKCRHSSPISIPYQSDIFVTDELTLTHPYHPKSIVYSSVYSQCCIGYIQWVWTNA